MIALAAATTKQQSLSIKEISWYHLANSNAMVKMAMFE